MVIPVLAGFYKDKLKVTPRGALFALIGGVLFGEYLGRSLGIQNVLEILVGFGCLGLSLVFIRFYNNIFKQNPKNQPVITKVIG